MLTVHVLVHCVLGEVNVAYDEGQACKQQHWPSFAFVCTLWYLSVCHSLCTMWHTFWCTTWPRFWYPIGMPQTKCGTKSRVWLPQRLFRSFLWYHMSRLPQVVHTCGTTFYVPHRNDTACGATSRTTLCVPRCGIACLGATIQCHNRLVAPVISASE